MGIESPREDLNGDTQMSDKTTTKVCSCGNTQLVLIQTQNLKWCPDCGAHIKWIKDKGQDDYY